MGHKRPGFETVLRLTFPSTLPIIISAPVALREGSEPSLDSKSALLMVSVKQNKHTSQLLQCDHDCRHMCGAHHSERIASDELNRRRSFRLVDLHVDQLRFPAEQGSRGKNFQTRLDARHLNAYCPFETPFPCNPIDHGADSEACRDF